ncbi:RNA methyltransferase [candidate division KSB1 bacterium]|nr:RNA methyltransferase [candidate division KSB1 bacterium]
METHLEVRSFDSHLALEEFENLPRMPIHLILDNLRSAFNVGSIVRTADCVLAEKIYFCGYTAHPPHKKLEKTSLGSLPYVPWEHHEDIAETVQKLKEQNIPIIALETTNRSQSIWEFEFPLPVALVMGNEALGVSHQILELADAIVEIPMLGYKNSINVAVASGIVSYEIQRQHWERFKHLDRLRKDKTQQNPARIE